MFRVPSEINHIRFRTFTPSKDCLTSKYQPDILQWNLAILAVASREINRIANLCTDEFKYNMLFRGILPDGYFDDHVTALIPKAEQYLSKLGWLSNDLDTRKEDFKDIDDDDNYSYAFPDALDDAFSVLSDSCLSNEELLCPDAKRRRVDEIEESLGYVY